MRTFDAWCRGAQSASEQSQLCELSKPTFGFTTQNLAWWRLHRRPRKTTKLSKLGGGCWPGGCWPGGCWPGGCWPGGYGHLPGTIWYTYMFSKRINFLTCVTPQGHLFLSVAKLAKLCLLSHVKTGGGLRISSTSWLKRIRYTNTSYTKCLLGITL